LEFLEVRGLQEVEGRYNNRGEKPEYQALKLDTRVLDAYIETSKCNLSIPLKELTGARREILR
jgi:hypothetical protein